MLISVDRTGKNELQPDQKSVGDAVVSSRRSLIRNPWPKTDRCAGALSRRRNQLLVLHFLEFFLLTVSLKRWRMLMYIHLFTVAVHVNFTGKFRKLSEATTYIFTCYFYAFTDSFVRSSPWKWWTSAKTCRADYVYRWLVILRFLWEFYVYNYNQYVPYE